MNETRQARIRAAELASRIEELLDAVPDATEARMHPDTLRDIAAELRRLSDFDGLRVWKEEGWPDRYVCDGCGMTAPVIHHVDGCTR